MDSQAFDNHDSREGVYIDHGLRTSSIPKDAELNDNNIHSQNEYLDKVKKIEIFGVDRKAMNTKIDELQNVSLLDHLLNHGTQCEAEATSTPTISSIEPTKETDTAGKWWILYRSDKETAVKTALEKSYHFSTTRNLNSSQTSPSAEIVRLGPRPTRIPSGI
jgi:hypothetical protein